MEHIRQYDWCALQPDTQYFVTESELDSCVTERILQNKFNNPLISSDSEDEGNGPKIDWNFVFSKKNHEQSYRIFVPGLRPPPAYARLSALSAQQHHQGLRVLCAAHPHVLPDEFMPRPTKHDQHAFANFKDIYLKEQQEYIEWAKTLWTNGQCIRALRPKPTIESVYEAEFRVRANQMRGYPKALEMVGQLPLEPAGQFEMVMEKELIGVNTQDLPQVRCPQIRSRLSVLRACATPEPCEQHPVRFILPNESSISVLPITEVSLSLAQYASEHGAQFVASEGALRCALQRRAWALPVSVHAVARPDGGSTNIVVLGSEFMNKQENVLSRTFRALRHLLEVALVPASELAKRGLAACPRPAAPAPAAPAPAPAADHSSDDEDNLFIDFDEDSRLATKDTDADATSNHSESDAEMVIDTNSVERERENETPNTNDAEMVIDTNSVERERENEAPNTNEVEPERGEEEPPSKKDNNKSIIEGFGVYRCTCRDTVFERPPPRSFRKWRFGCRGKEHYDVIVHCAHKFKGSEGEALVEPIPEYQADLGASRQCDDRLASTALSLALRGPDTTVLTVRLDAQSGDIITAEECSREQFYREYGESGAAGVIHTLLGQLQGLVPGHYVIQHEPSHGNNALLYAPRATGGAPLRLQFDSSQPAEADEARSVKTPPRITPALLPWHKFRKILPCAFSHYSNQLAKPRQLPARRKTPPRALKSKEEKGGHQKKWPKKRGCRKKAE